MPNFSIVVAMDFNQGIGKEGKLPWHLPGDIKYFKDLTSRTKDPDKKNAVIMGRKTWESIPDRFRPLAGRKNFILTSNSSIVSPADVVIVNSFDRCLEVLDQEILKNRIESVFVIGGAAIYQQAVKRPECRCLYVTQIQSQFICDAFFPPFEYGYQKVHQSSLHEEKGFRYQFLEYQKI